MTEAGSPPRVVLDTNVLLRALMNRASRSREIVVACEARAAIAVLSKPLIDEYRRVLVHLRTHDESITTFEIQSLLRRLRYFGDYQRKIRASFPFARDPTDAKLIELAIDAQATHIITYDADLLSLPRSPKRGRQAVPTATTRRSRRQAGRVDRLNAGDF